MSHQTGIQANAALKKYFSKCRDGKVRVLKVSIENEQLVLAKDYPPKKSWEHDFDKYVPSLIVEDLPCFILFRLDTTNSLGHEWLLLSWSPDTAAVRHKMLYASTKATLKQEFGSAHIKDEMHATVIDEVSLKGYKAHLNGVSAPAPLTNREEALKELQESEVTTNYGTDSRQSTMGGVAFPITEAAKQGINDLKRDLEEEQIHLSKAAKISLIELPEQVPSDQARYHLYIFSHTHEGDHMESIVFIYSMPGYNCSIKERMMYSSCKGQFLDIIEHTGLIVAKRGGPNTVLRVIIEHMLYPIVLDVLYSIFQRYGKVLKIVTFTKNNSFQALIQYPDTVSAQTAKTALDGQNIYNGCCTLRIDYSKMTCLNVKYNNDKSRDYTNPTLPSGDGEAHHQLLSSGGVLAPQFLGLGSGLASPYGVGVGGLPAFGALTLTPASPALRALTAPPLPLATVLLVSNLNEEMVTPDALFTLFGVYGDVQRVKILYNKKDSALIQMAEPHQAHLAMTHMDKLRVFGKAMRVMLSKHQTVQLPKEGQPDAGLTRDYSQSPLHRFKKPGSKNYQNIYPPSATLHLSNIPATVSEEDIKDAFSKRGFAIKAFKFFPKDRKMALVQLPSIDDAVTALIKMHNYQLSESNHLRVSFSKSSI